jgi:hypothetical protein
MKNGADFSALLQGFFTQRLLQQKQVSSHTIASYRDTFRLLLQYIQRACTSRRAGWRSTKSMLL